MEVTDAPAVVVNTPVAESKSAGTNEKQDEPTSNKAVIYVLLAVIAIIAIYLYARLVIPLTGSKTPTSSLQGHKKNKWGINCP